MNYNPEVRNNAVDEFITPSRLIEETVKLLTRHFDRAAPIRVLDPGANLGQWGAVVRTLFPNAHIVGVEIMEIDRPSAYNEYYVHDFLTWETNQKFDIVIGNPPYSRPKRNIAEMFVRKSYDLLVPEGWLYFLLRTNFANAKSRSRGLFQTHKLTEMWFVDRPSFYEQDPRTAQFGKKKTNMHDYSLYIWQKDFIGLPTIDFLMWSD